MRNNLFNVRRSFSMAQCNHSVGEASGRPIQYGDRIYVSVSMRGRVILEFERCDVNDYSALMAIVRKEARGVVGLTNVFVRNMSRGWSMTQPFKLYADLAPSACRHQYALRSERVQPSSPSVAGRRAIPESISLLYGAH